MPKQDPTNPTQLADQNQKSPVKQPLENPTIHFSSQVDLLPLPPEFQSLNSENVSSTTTTSNSGSTTPPAPSFSDITSSPKKKFGTGKIIATILGIFVLIGGLGAGIFLTQQKQIFQQKASGATGCLCPEPNDNNIPCIKSNGINYVDLNTPAGCSYCNWSWEGWGCCPGGGDACSPIGSIKCVTTPKVLKCNQYSPYCSSGVWQPIAYYNTISELCTDSRCANESFCRPPTNPPTNTPNPTPSPSPSPTPSPTPTPPFSPSPTPSPTPTPPFSPSPTPAAPYCAAVSTYDSDWTLIPASERSLITEGQTVNFCVSGVAASGSFDKARFTIFTINGGQQSETIDKRPGSSDFCQSYTIPSGTTTFTVSAQIHHSSGEWF